MAYGAYQIAQPTMTLQDQLIRGRGQQDVGAEVATKKRSLKEDLLEQMRRRQKSAKKRAGSFLGVEGLGTGITTALDFAAGFVDPATAAIMGAVSGGLSGFNQMSSAYKLKGETQRFEQYGFLSPQVQGMKSQIKGQQKNFGDVLMSAGTQALQNFAMGKASEAMAGAKAADKGGKAAEAFKMKPNEAGIGKSWDSSKTARQFGAKPKFGAPEGWGTKVDIAKGVKPGGKPSFGKQGYGQRFLKGGDATTITKGLDPTLKGASAGTTIEPSKIGVDTSKVSAPKGYQGAQKAKILEGGLDFSTMKPDEIMSTLTQMGTMYAPILQGLTEQGEQYPEIDFSSLY